jgi:hypothetical protein
VDRLRDTSIRAAPAAHRHGDGIDVPWQPLPRKGLAHAYYMLTRNIGGPSSRGACHA